MVEWSGALRRIKGSPRLESRTQKKLKFFNFQLETCEKLLRQQTRIVRPCTSAPEKGSDPCSSFLPNILDFEEHLRRPRRWEKALQMDIPNLISLNSCEGSVR